MGVTCGGLDLYAAVNFPQFNITSSSGDEGTEIVFTVTRTTDSPSENQSVDYSAIIEAGDTASNSDFTEISGTLDFLPGELSKTFNVQTTTDSITELDETFTVQLSNNIPTCGSSLDVTTAKGTINNVIPYEVNIIPVIDRSGSMISLAEDGGSMTKMGILKSETDYFINVRMPKGDTHKLGLVQFNENVVPFQSTTLPPSYIDADTHLAILSDDVRVTKLRTAINDMQPGGLTSIGDGLREALNQFIMISPPPTHRAIMLITDGKENYEELINGGTIQTDLMNAGIRVYSLGLGYGSGGIDEGILSTLATATNGDYIIANNELDYRKSYLNMIAAATGLSVGVDPVYELAANESITITVPVASDESAVLFESFWKDINDAVILTLVPPNETLAPITATSASGSIKYNHDSRHASFKVDLPWSHHHSEDWIGNWKIKLTGNDNIPAGTKVKVTASALIKGGAKLKASFDKPVYQTGDTILATAKIKRNNNPIAGARVLVVCDVPTESAGNVLHDGQVDPNALNPYAKIEGDQISLAEQKLQLLEDAASETLLTRDELLVELFDDGAHSDGLAADGVYANSFENTEIPGTFNCRFLASDIPTNSAIKTQREWTIAFYNEVAIDPDSSDIDILLTKQTADGNTYRVTVVPRDRFGNYIGPGYPVNARWQIKGSKFIAFNDPLVSGIYQGQLFLPKADANKDIPMQIKIGKKVFNDVRVNQWSWSFHAGLNSPQGNFAQLYDGGLSVTFDLDYRLDSQRSIVGLFGYHQFDAKSQNNQDTDWMHVSVNYKYRFNTMPFKPYLMGGIGYYDQKNGSGDMGANLSAGLEYPMNPNLTLQLGIDGHKITDNQNTEFINTHFGFILKF